MHTSNFISQVLGDSIWVLQSTPQVAFADLRGFGELLKPIWKPLVIPVIKNCTSSWLWWVARSDVQFSAFKGVVMAVASCGTLTTEGESDRWAFHAGTHSWYGEQMSSRWMLMIFSLDKAKRGEDWRILLRLWACGLTVSCNWWNQ